MHAIAQLADDVVLELPGQLPARASLSRLARAYGVSDRVLFVANDKAETGLSIAVQLDDHQPLGGLVESLTNPEDPPTSLRVDDEIFRGQRIALVTNLPSSYRLPLFEAMTERIREARGALRIFFAAQTSQSRPWLTGYVSGRSAFDGVVLTSLTLPVRERPPLVPVDLELQLARFQPTIVVAGSLSPLVAGRVAAYAARKGIPWGPWSGETARTGPARATARAAQRARLLRRADFAVAYGHAALRYLRELNRDVPIVVGRNTAPVVGPSGDPRREGGDVEVVAVGDLASARKGIDVVLEAFRLRPRLPCRLSVIGSGKLLPELTALAADDSRIAFLGSRPPEEVQAVYRRASIMLFPTRRDIFGLALAEGMGAGLATVVSTAAGAVDDLAVDRLNALVLDTHDPHAWADALAGLVENPAYARALGERAQGTIRRRWTIEHAADAMLAGLRLGLMRGAAS